VRAGKRINWLIRQRDPVGSIEEGEGVRIENIKPQDDRHHLLGNKSIYMLAEGRLVNLACATRAS
jgi:S-adenosylhomocysteine hydrolase